MNALALIASLAWVDAFADCDARRPLAEIVGAAEAAGMDRIEWTGLARRGAVLRVLSRHDGAWALLSVWPDVTACVRASGEASSRKTRA